MPETAQIINGPWPEKAGPPAPLPPGKPGRRLTGKRLALYAGAGVTALWGLYDAGVFLWNHMEYTAPAAASGATGYLALSRGRRWMRWTAAALFTTASTAAMIEYGPPLTNYPLPEARHSWHWVMESPKDIRERLALEKTLADQKELTRQAAEKARAERKTKLDGLSQTWTPLLAERVTRFTREIIDPPVKQNRLCPEEQARMKFCESHGGDDAFRLYRIGDQRALQGATYLQYRLGVANPDTSPPLINMMVALTYDISLKGELMETISIRATTRYAMIGGKERYGLVASVQKSLIEQTLVPLGFQASILETCLKGKEKSATSVNERCMVRGDLVEIEFQRSRPLLSATDNWTPQAKQPSRWKWFQKTPEPK